MPSNLETYEEALKRILQSQLQTIQSEKSAILTSLSQVDDTLPTSRITAIQNILLEDYRHQCSLEQQVRNDYTLHFQSHQTLTSAERTNIIGNRTSHLTVAINGTMEYAKGFLNFLSLFSAGSVAALITFLSTNNDLLKDNTIVKSQIYDLIGCFLALSIASLFLWALSHISTSASVYQSIADYDKSFFIPKNHYNDESDRAKDLSKANTTLAITGFMITFLDIITYIIAFICLIILIYKLHEAYIAIQPYIVKSVL